MGRWYGRGRNLRPDRARTRRGAARHHVDAQYICQAVDMADVVRWMEALNVERLHKKSTSTAASGPRFPSPPTPPRQLTLRPVWGRDRRQTCSRTRRLARS